MQSQLSFHNTPAPALASGGQRGPLSPSPRPQRASGSAQTSNRGLSQSPTVSQGLHLELNPAFGKIIRDEEENMKGSEVSHSYQKIQRNEVSCSYSLELFNLLTVNFRGHQPGCLYPFLSFTYTGHLNHTVLLMSKVSDHHFKDKEDEAQRKK